MGEMVFGWQTSGRTWGEAQFAGCRCCLCGLVKHLVKGAVDRRKNDVSARKN